ncbi:MAG: PQQ-binding-like beta-propeller repeat protein [Alphaproteobacteria bacterium]|nr:PQQ-binding-like beta-propeller repeat protein [Alphaproteobacteria bacterium]
MRTKIFFLISILLVCGCHESKNKYINWEVYNGTNSGIKYSSLNQVNTTNVTQLEVAWIYKTGDADTIHSSQIQCNPIVVDGILYGVGPAMKLFAIDAQTGKEKWVFDVNARAATLSDTTKFHNIINSRGIAYWTDGKQDSRIFFTAGSYTYAVNAKTGKPIADFGNNGSIDLHDDLGRDVKDMYVSNSSPGMVFKDLIILGTRIDEEPPAAPGHIRAYNAITGKLQWIFHTIPQPGEYGFDSWEDTNAWKHAGAANDWAGFTLDEERGILFVPTGSAVYDFYGGKRKGANLFANCLLALDAASGKRLWHFQFVHHDLWDRDLPSPPVLVRITKNGKQIDAVAQTTKTGMVYVFERETGKPVFEINEVPFDTISELKGEKVWPTQPIPKHPQPFVRQTFTIKDINPYLSSQKQIELKETLKTYRFGKMFLPPGLTPSVLFPGFDGGSEWGGPSYDPETGILYVNANEIPWIIKMNPNKTEIPKHENWLQAGKRLYLMHCAECHATNLQGSGNNPSLIQIKSKYKISEFSALVLNGRRRMPGFKKLQGEEINALATYILELKKEQNRKFKSVTNIDSINEMPYKMAGYTKFYSSDGYPAITPPWGTLNAINLNTGDLIWKKPLGEYEALKLKGIAATGTENYGGSVVTAGGLVFIAASRDAKFRAFDKKTGNILWEYPLPAAGFATPAIYELHGKQYIVIACGGGKLNTTSYDAFVAFTLPNKN